MLKRINITLTIIVLLGALAIGGMFVYQKKFNPDAATKTEQIVKGVFING